MGASRCILIGFLSVLCLLHAVFVTAEDGSLSICQELDPSPVLQPFVDELPILKEIDTSSGNQVVIGAYKIKQKLHRDLPETLLYAFGTSPSTASSPGPTLVAQRFTESQVRFENHIEDLEHFLTVDRTIMATDPKHGGIPNSVHLHGGEVESDYDGHPTSWRTAFGELGPSYATDNFTFPNAQPAALIWYHDHSLGLTRLNMLAGLFGLYLIKSQADEPAGLPSGENEILLTLQDKQFYPNGSINFPNVGNSPKIHPSWCPEYFGDTIVVNGKAWPYLNVYPTKYRFRLLNAANARFFLLSLDHPKLRFYQIGTDGGFLHKPQKLHKLTVAPAERVDFIIDFSSVEVGHSVYLNNSGDAPFPDGDPSFSPPSTQSVLKFSVVSPPDGKKLKNEPIPKTLGPQISLSTSKAITRHLTLKEFDDDDGNPIVSKINDRHFMDEITEIPVEGTTEIWEIINFTDDGHPIHIHLINFIVKTNQNFDKDAYDAKNCSLEYQYPDPRSCFIEHPRGPLPHQKGWKDTAVVYPHAVTRFALRWANRNGSSFPFDPTTGAGYVWHCHILDHEDNDMMRPLKLVH